jgi:hypothetical protein
MAISRDFKPMKLHGHMKSRMHVIAIFWDMATVVVGYIFGYIVGYIQNILGIFFPKYHD